MGSLPMFLFSDTKGGDVVKASPVALLLVGFLLMSQLVFLTIASPALLLWALVQRFSRGKPASRK